MSVALVLLSGQRRHSAVRCYQCDTSITITVTLRSLPIFIKASSDAIMQCTIAITVSVTLVLLSGQRRHSAVRCYQCTIAITVSVTLVLLSGQRRHSAVRCYQCYCWCYCHNSVTLHHHCHSAVTCRIRVTLGPPSSSLHIPVTPCQLPSLVLRSLSSSH